MVRFIPLRLLLLLLLLLLQYCGIAVVTATTTVTIPVEQHLEREDPITTAYEAEPPPSVDEVLEEGNTSDSNNSDSTVHHHPMIQEFVNLYVDLLDDVIYHQTMTWNMVQAYRSIDEAKEGWCPKQYPQPRHSDYQQQQQQQQQPLEYDTPDNFVYDSEADIPLYFQQLLEGCAIHCGVAPHLFEAKCWGIMRELVEQPRCTTVYDTRVECDGTKLTHPPTTTSAKYPTLRNESNVINVIIIGAGPVGQYLANALSRHNDDIHEAQGFSFDITIIDHRTTSLGTKPLFARDWDTYLYVKEMEALFDPRILDIFRYLSTDGNEFFLPFNVVETLFYLSNRQYGVNYIFDAEYTDWFADFLDQTHNPLVFDATGHRLNTVIRGKRCQDSPEPETITKWKAPDLTDNHRLAGVFNRYLVTDYQTMEEYDSTVHIAQQGDLLYPVYANGNPIHSQWMFVNNLPYEKHHYDLEGFDWTMNTDTALCVACGQGEIESERLCKLLCRPQKWYYNIGSHRDDIANYLHTQPGGHVSFINLRAWLISLKADQARVFKEILHEYGWEKEIKGIPLRLWPLDRMNAVPALHENGVMDALNQHADLILDDEPVLTFFEYRPYVYTTPIVRDSPLFHDVSQKPTMLRIGDAFLSGDSNHSTGLVVHVWVLRRLICRLLGQSSECSIPKVLEYGHDGPDTHHAAASDVDDDESEGDWDEAEDVGDEGEYAYDETEETRDEL